MITHCLFRGTLNSQRQIIQPYFVTSHITDVSQTSVTAENLLINNRSNGQTVKTVCECLPELYVEPAFA